MSSAPPRITYDNEPAALDISFAHRKVQPPTLVYVPADSSIRLALANSLSGVQITTIARVLLPNGQIQRNEWLVTPTSDRVTNLVTLPIPHGFLLSVVILCLTTSPKRGQCFVRAFVAVGQGGGIQFQQLLVSDYLTGNAPLGWPGGRQISSVEEAGNFRFIRGTDPAAGTNMTEAVPTAARWRLHGLAISLITNATVGNRAVRLWIQDLASFAIPLQVEAPGTQAASLNFQYVFSAFGTQYIGASTTRIHTPLAPALIVPAGGTINVGANGLAAGDDFGAPDYLVEEWLES